LKKIINKRKKEYLAEDRKKKKTSPEGRPLESTEGAEKRTKWFIKKR